MMNWWNGLSPRERGMIFLAGALTLLFGVYFLIMQPLANAREEAERDYRRMSAEAAQLYSGLAQLQGRQSGGVGEIQGQNESLELLLSRSSSARGLQIVRLQPSGQGELTVWFDSANPQTLMSWLTELEQRYAIGVRKADLRKSNQGVGLRGNVQVFREARS